MPYGHRGNSIVRFFDESYDNIVLVAGFSKAYSSLAAFLALPTSLKNHLKVAAPPYLYSGPSPTGVAGHRAGRLRVNESEGDDIRRSLAHKTRRVLDQSPRARAANPQHLGSTRSSSCPSAMPTTSTRWGGSCSTGGSTSRWPPTRWCPEAQVGFRVQVTAANDDGEIDQLNEVLAELAERFDMQRATDG